MAATQKVTYAPNNTADTVAVKLLSRAAKIVPGKPLTNPSNGRAAMGTQVQGGGRIKGGRG